MGASQRRKGAVGEREWCDVLRVNSFPNAKRDIGQSRDGGGDVHEPPFLYEVKRHAKFAVYDHYKQAKVSAIGTGLVPAVALRGDNEAWLVVLDAQDFLSMLNAARLSGWPVSTGG